VAEKKKKLASRNGGPYLQAALLCERILRETDGSITIVRIIDRVTFQVPDVPLPGTALFGGLGYQLWAFLSFKTGSARGKKDLRIKSFSPDGSKAMDDLVLPLEFDGEGESGAIATIQMNVLFRTAGIHWFRVFLDGRLITHVPLRVVIQKVTSGSPLPSVNIAKK
jgi:hypothetical protein